MESHSVIGNSDGHWCLRMGPFNEMRQLSRRGAVLQLLQKNNLSEWARNYWGTVYDTIAMDQERYNARVITTFKNSTPGVVDYGSEEQ